MSAATLVLFGGVSPEAPFAWRLLDSRGGEKLQGVASESERAPPASGAHTILVLPGAEAQVRRVALHACTDAQARAGATYVFEGALVGQSDMHFALGAAQDADGHRLAAAISGARLTAWLDACEKIAARPHAVFLDFTLLPVAAETVEVWQDGDVAVVAAGLFGGFAIEAPLAPRIFARWAGQSGMQIKQLAVAASLSGDWTHEVAPAGAALTYLDAGDFRAALAAAAANAPDAAPNLRQGAFAPPGHAVRGWKIWRLVVVLAITAIIVQATANAIAGWRDAAAAEKVLAGAETAFREARPEVRRIVNLRAQVRSVLNAGGDAQSHPVLKASEPLIRAQQAHPQTRLDALRHSAPGRNVQLRFSAETAPPLEALAAELRAQSGAFETRELTIEDGRYVMDITLESPP